MASSGLRLLAASLISLAGCASLVPQLQPPQLQVAQIELGNGNGVSQQVHVTLHVDNPNDRALDIRGIDVQLQVSGQAFAQGSTDAAFRVPAMGESDFGVTVTADMNQVLAATLGSLGRHTVDYRLFGTVHLGSGLLRNIPFDQRGQVRL